MSKGFRNTVAAILLLVAGFAGGIAIAADFDDTTEVIRPVQHFRRSGFLVAGQKITDVAGVSGLAAKTVPAGRWAIYNIRIDVQLTNVDPNPAP